MSRGDKELGELRFTKLCGTHLALQKSTGHSCEVLLGSEGVGKWSSLWSMTARESQRLSPERRGKDDVRDEILQSFRRIHGKTTSSSSTSPTSPGGAPSTREVRSPTFTKLKDLDDNELMAHLQGGCNDALAVLFDRYYRLVLSIALKIVRDPGEAENGAISTRATWSMG